MAIRSTLALIKETQAKAPHVKAGILVNMIKPGSGLTKDIAGVPRKHMVHSC